MKRWLRLLLACALTLIGAARADEPKSPNAQKLCPVMNLPINPKLYVDFEGKRIYVCCPHCLEKVKDNPKKFIRQLESEGITLEPVPKEEKKGQVVGDARREASGVSRVCSLLSLFSSSPSYSRTS